MSYASVIIKLPLWMRHAIMKKALEKTVKANDKPWYLIEYAQKGVEPPMWWTGLWFSANTNDTARFPIKAHAEAALERLQTTDDMDRCRLIVTEHLWMEEILMDDDEGRDPRCICRGFYQPRHCPIHGEDTR